jgi:hypothetical protein
MCRRDTENNGAEVRRVAMALRRDGKLLHEETRSGHESIARKKRSTIQNAYDTRGDRMTTGQLWIIGPRCQRTTAQKLEVGTAGLCGWERHSPRRPVLPAAFPVGSSVPVCRALVKATRWLQCSSLLQAQSHQRQPLWVSTAVCTAITPPSDSLSAWSRPVFIAAPHSASLRPPVAIHRRGPPRALPGLGALQVHGSGSVIPETSFVALPHSRRLRQLRAADKTIRYSYTPPPVATPLTAAFAATEDPPLVTYMLQ